MGPRFDDHEKKLAARFLAPDPPNLKGTILAPREEALSTVELEQLDVLEPVGNKNE